MLNAFIEIGGAVLGSFYLVVILTATAVFATAGGVVAGMFAVWVLS